MCKKINIIKDKMARLENPLKIKCKRAKIQK